MRTTLMKVGRRRAIDQQAAQLGPAVVAARVHQALALVNPREVRISDYFAFFRSQRLTHQCAVGATIAVKQPLEIGPMLQPVSFMICAC